MPPQIPQHWVTLRATGVLDCNLDGIDDFCDIQDGTSQDCDANGIPDEDVCQPGSQNIALLTTVPVGTEFGSSDVRDSLWRSAKNTLRFTFACNITAPSSNVFLIREMQSGGTYGANLSGSFTLTVENDAGGKPRVLKIRETGTALTHQKWYAFQNDGGWSGVGNFIKQNVLPIGDATNDRNVLAADVLFINAAPPGPVGDQSRVDINGDGFKTATDVGLANAYVPSLATEAPKPTGH